MIKFGPKAQLTADTDYWGNYYTERAKAVLDGKWKSEDTWGGLDAGMVVMSPYTNMPDDVKKMAMETEAAIKAGTLHPFKCPVVDQDGKTLECKGGDSSRRRANPEHELLRQGHRRQSPRKVVRRPHSNASSRPGRRGPAVIVCRSETSAKTASQAHPGPSRGRQLPR